MKFLTYIKEKYRGEINLLIALSGEKREGLGVRHFISGLLVYLKFAKLSKLEKFVLKRSFGIGATRESMIDIVQATGYSREKIRHVRQTAIQKLASK